MSEEKPPSSRRQLWIGTIVVFVVCLAYQSVRMFRPFIGDMEGTACGLVMQPPLNYLRYGPFTKHFGGVINTGVVDANDLTAYTHHPPLVTIIAACFHAVLGRADWVARLPPALFTSGTAALLFLVLARRGLMQVAILSAAIFITLPINTFFGGMPDYVNSQVVFFSVLTLALWLESVESTAPWKTAAPVAAFLLAALSDWPGFYVVAVIWIAAWTIRRRWSWFCHLLFPAIGAATLGLLAAWMPWAGADRSLLWQFLRRSSGTRDDTGQAASIGQWLHDIAGMMAELNTWPVLILAMLFPVLLTLSRVLTGEGRVGAGREGSPDDAENTKVARPPPLPSPGVPGEGSGHRFLFLLIGLFLVHFLVARQGTLQHEWWHMPFTPAIACCCATSVATLWQIGNRAVFRLGNGDGLRTTARSTKPWHPAFIALVGVVSIPLAISSFISDRHRRSIFADAGGYTLRDLGLTMRDVSDPHDGVLTSDCSDWTHYGSQPPLGWYADRQFRSCIIDAASLEWGLKPGRYFLSYGYWQPAGPAPRWFVMPHADHARWPELGGILDSRYPHSYRDGFDVYDLRSVP